MVEPILTADSVFVMNGFVRAQVGYFNYPMNTCKNFYPPVSQNKFKIMLSTMLMIMQLAAGK